MMQNQNHEGQDRITENDEFRDEFQCCICLDLMYKPVVLPCGHISCFWCVFNSMDMRHHSHCSVCRKPYYHFPRVCKLMHRLLLDLYPVIYERRAKQVAEEEKKHGHKSPQFEDNLIDSKVGEAFDAKEVSSPVPMGNTPVESDSKRQENPCVVESSDRASAYEDDMMALHANSAKEDKDGNDPHKKILTHLQCAVCNQLLLRPMVLNCGHVQCEACINIPDDSVYRCQVCQSSHPYESPKVCLVLQHFLEDYFPEEYSVRKDSFANSQKACSSVGSLEKEDTVAKQSSGPKDFHSIWWTGRARFIHRGVGCDYCGMCPILGTRYKCKDCVEEIGFDLCEECYRSSSKLPGRFNQQHTPEHQFDVFPPRSTSDTTLSEHNLQVVDSDDTEGVPLVNSNSREGDVNATDAGNATVDVRWVLNALGYEIDDEVMNENGDHGTAEQGGGGDAVA